MKVATECTLVCDCKIANHEHGTRAMYVAHKCRGPKCREACRVYEAKRVRQRAYGVEANLVDAQPVRDHIEHLRASGVSYKSLALASGVSHSAIGVIVYGRKERNAPPTARVRPETAEKILAVEPTMDNMASGRNICSTGTHRRIQALVSIGYSITNLGERLNITSSNMRDMLSRKQVLVSTARKVRALYEDLWDKPNDATEWQWLAAATRARNYAAIHSWLPPMAWDDDLIDDPNHTPDMAPMPTVPKVEAKRAAFLEEVEFFADAGYRIEALAEVLGMSPEAVEKRLSRYERSDLLRKIGHAPKSRKEEP